jgi:hypothetical protein
VKRTNYHYITAAYGAGSGRVWYVNERRTASVVAAGNLWGSESAFFGVAKAGTLIAVGGINCARPGR